MRSSPADGDGPLPSTDEGPPWPPADEQALLDRAQAYARTVDIDVDVAAVSWEVSRRAKRRAGACRFRPDDGTVTIRLAWRAAEQFSWPEYAEVVRHELVHAWEFQRVGEAGHGPRFRREADRLGVPTTCPRFTPPRLRLRCTAPACDWSAARHRASAVVTEPERRRCGACGGRYAVEHVASGERWETAAGYRTARARIDEW